MEVKKSLEKDKEHGKNIRKFGTSGIFDPVRSSIPRFYGLRCVACNRFAFWQGYFIEKDKGHEYNHTRRIY